MPGFGIRVRHIDDVRDVSDSGMQLVERFGSGAMQGGGAKHDARERQQHSLHGSL
jgi:hypothetical protein